MYPPTYSGKISDDKHQDIVAHHSTYDKSSAGTRQNAKLETLGFVTPWNNRGYDIVPPLSSETNIFKGKMVSKIHVLPHIHYKG